MPTSTGILSRIGMAPPAPLSLLEIEEEEKEREEQRKKAGAGNGILSRIGMGIQAAPVAMPKDPAEPERDAARARLEAAKAGGEQQWAEIQAAPQESPVEQFARVTKRTFSPTGRPEVISYDDEVDEYLAWYDEQKKAGTLDKEEAGRRWARLRLNQTKRVGEEQWQNIQASQRDAERYSLGVNQDAAEVGKALVRMADSTLGMGQSAIEALAAAHRVQADRAAGARDRDAMASWAIPPTRDWKRDYQLVTGEDPDALGLTVASPGVQEALAQVEAKRAQLAAAVRDAREPSVVDVGAGRQERESRATAEFVEDVAKRHPRLPKVLVAQSARTPGYIPDDFWEGMKSDPVKTLAINGVENIGSLVAMLGASAVAGPPGGLTVAGSLTTGGIYSEAKERGASDEEALRAVGVAAVPSMLLEYFPVGRAIARMSKGVPEGEVFRVVQGAIKSAAEEGTTESMQRIVEILGARVAYAEDRGWGWKEAKDVLMNGVIGAVTGGPFGGVTAAAGGAQQQVAPGQEAEPPASRPPTPADRPAGAVPAVESTPPPAASSSPPQEGGEVAPEPTSLRRRVAQAIDPTIQQEQERRQVAERERDTDALTGLANQRALDRALDTAEADPETAIVAFDANDFGRINKTEGHEAGDAAIKKMAEAVRTAAGEAGVGGRVFRRGGDEIVALVPMAQAEAVRDRAETLFGEIFGEGYRVTLTGEVGRTFAHADSKLQARKAERKAIPAPESAQAAPAPVEAPATTQETTPTPQTSAPAPAVTEASPAELDLEPERFQFKLNRDAAGSTGSLAGVQEWDANLAGVVSVWRDPADNRLKVVNGHNRIAKARQLGAPSVRVLEIDAPTAEKARAIGAMQNIAEGHGTPVDAAKFFRDTDQVNQVEVARRLPLLQATVDQGLGLAGLSDFLFGQVTRGDLAPQRGAIIGRHLRGKNDLQNQLYKEIAKREKRSRVTNEMVEDIARRMESSGTVTEESNQGSLFGDGDASERSLAFEEADIASDIRQRLRRQKSAFGNAARNAPLLSEAGNVIDQEMSRGLSEQAAVNLAVFDKLRNTTEIGGIISEAARNLASGKESSDAIKTRTFDRIREAVASVLGTRASTAPAGVREDGEAGSGTGRTADSEQLTEADTAAQQRQKLEEQGQGGLFAGAAGAADTGGYSSARATAGRPRSMPLNLPELVEVAQLLGNGKLPSVKKALRAAGGEAVGVFRSSTGNLDSAGISLRADLPLDPDQAKRTLAHEIGHWVDFLPDATLKRGNILGSIATLKKYMKGHLDALPVELSRMLTSKERGRIARQAKKGGVEFADALAAEAERRDLIGREQVVEELKALSEKWKPIPKGADEKYLKYRHHPRELYADALSVLLNDPAMLEQEAPIFTRSFFGYLNRKPEVAQAYLDIQERIAKGEAARLDSVEERVSNMVQRGGILRAQELLARQKESTIGEIARHAGHALVDGMIDRHSPLQRRVNLARKRGMALSPKANPIYWLEEMAYLNSEAAAYLDRFQENILYPLRSVGINDSELGQLLFLRRVAGERAALWNPLGVDVEVAPALVERLEAKWGRDKAKLVTESLNRWWRLRQPLIEKVIESGAVTPENAEKMRTNPEYARFFVQSFLEGEGAAPKGSAMGALKEQIGTLQEIGNPLVETVLTDIALLRLAHRNSTAQAMVKFMESTFPDEVTEAKRGTGGRIEETRENKKATVRYFVDGKARGVHMPEEVAQSLESHLTENVLYQAWMRFGQSPIRTVFVERNPGWALWNLKRDTTALWKQVVKGNPASSAVKTVAALAKAAPHAWKAVAGKNSETVREMLEQRMLVQPGERMYRAAEINEATALNELLQHYHLFGSLEQQTPSRRAQWGRFFDRFTPFSKKPGEFTERWTKIAGYMYLKAHQQEFGLTDQEVAHQVRTRVGTPDVYRRGKWFRLYNSMLLFSNVNKEGWRAAVETAKERPVEYVAKTALQIGGGVVMTHALGYAMFGDDWEEWWAKVPDHDKRSFGILPLGTTEDGKAVYARLPFDYTGQVVNAIVQTAFDGKKLEKKKDALGRLFVESFPYSWANFHPYIEVSLATFTYAGEGKNPYDHFTGRPVIKPRTWEAGKYGGDAVTEYSRWMWNQLGGRLLVQWDTEEIDPERGLLEGLLHWPIVGPFLGRVYKVSSYGLEEKAWEILEEERGEKGKLSIARERFILQALDGNEEITVRDLHRAMKDLGIAYEDRGTLKTRVEKLRARHMRNDPLERVATFAGSKEARERILNLGKEKEEKEAKE